MDTIPTPGSTVQNAAFTPEAGERPAPADRRSRALRPSVREHLELTDVVTIAEAAGYLKVTRQTIHALINRGELRRFKVGSCTRIPTADVLALVGGGPNEAA